MTSKFTTDWHKRFRQQGAWTWSVREYLFHRCSLVPFPRVMEIGSGTGAILQDLSNQNFILFGLDINEIHLSQAIGNASEASYTQGDAHLLPFPTNSFDLVFCHFLLMWVENPIGVLGEMTRITKPGGNILAMAEPDYGGRLDFPKELELMGNIQTESLKMQGADPFIGRKLSSLFQNAGLINIEAGIIGSQWSDRTELNSWECEMSVFESDYLYTSIESDMFEFERLKALDKTARQKGERVLFVPTFYVMGMVK